ncbi:M15 family metallopeptidase [Clostridium bornimense]|uniref:M15 family metallopeptidase n=1 Tax=Clostridium bornimense TaxID=1216932 RepID=UPI001C1057BF|nr:M15 family metallopeptidase [Clostridium bornimense]MBU5315624.1 M15 family metallopeptidase [Clostridium bornimense]
MKKMRVKNKKRFSIFLAVILLAGSSTVIALEKNNISKHSTSSEKMQSDGERSKSNDSTNNKNNSSNEDKKKQLLDQYNYKDSNSIFVLVNKENKLQDGYIPTDLVEINDNLVNKPIQMRSEAAEALNKMIAEGKENGLSMLLTSGYRSSDSQESLYSDEVATRGEGINYVAPPGTSEHETGLAIDITSNKIGCKLEDTFDTTDEGKWLKDNAHKFGFILRYPKDKEEITGYLYEPWHFRYVGVELAGVLYEKNLTLEEYYEVK